MDHESEETTSAKAGRVGGDEKNRKIGIRKVLAEMTSELSSEG